MRRFIAGTLFIALIALIAGCASSSSGSRSTTPPPATQNPTSAAPVHSTSSKPTASTHARAAVSGLTGFGATRAAWNATHTADANPKLVTGCCYGPVIDTVDQANADTYSLSASAPKVISAFTRNFAPHTTEAQALADLRHDLPPDSVQVQAKIGDDCKEFVYSSKLLAKNPEFDARFSFGLYSAQSNSSYSPSNIEQAVVSAASTLGGC